MTTISEIKDAVSVFTEADIPKENITILHCNTEYPTPMDDVNLKAMLHIHEVFGTEIGYPDHTLGIEVPIATITLGASVIEKHFNLNCNMQGPDHKTSLELDELKAMVSAILNIEKAVGDGIRKVTDSEEDNIPIERKSIVTARVIKKVNSSP